MSVAFLILLPVLLSGYVFANEWMGAIYKISREEGYGLYFRSAYYGCAIVAMSFFVYLLLVANLGFFFESVTGAMIQALEIQTSMFLPLLSISFISLLIAHPLAMVLNYAMPHFIELKFINDAITGDDLEELLFRSMAGTTAIQVSMENRKHYIGFAVSGYNPEKDSDFVKILPLMSGYRDEATLKFIPTTFYGPVYEAIEQNIANGTVQFELLLPRAEIHGIGSFDFEAYDEFQRQHPGQPEEDEPIGDEPVGDEPPIAEVASAREYRQYRDYREYCEYQE
ncbi:MAG: hypothetical protein RPR91_10660 [Colwellia sp.]